MLINVSGRLYSMECWMFWIMNEVMVTYHGWARQRKKRKTKKKGTSDDVKLGLWGAHGMESMFQVECLTG
jgi:hypothetical protein